MRKLRAFLWRQAGPLALCGVGLAILAAATVVPATTPAAKHTTTSRPADTASQQIDAAVPAQDQSGTSKPSGSRAAGGTSTPKQGSVAGATTANPAASPAEATGTAGKSSQPATVPVTLRVNSTLIGTVDVDAGGTQCDVLTQAYQHGQLSSLVMRYNSQYQTQAVYVINGQGYSDIVYWTYEVNGKSPPYGCSKVPVHSGDVVQWEYVK